MLPDIGKIKDNIFFAHGYSGHGVALSTMPGKIVADAISTSAERFDLMAGITHRKIPFSTILRWPILAATMAIMGLQDRLRK
jgi:gamma-glutamylputrescine oxidase